MIHNKRSNICQNLATGKVLENEVNERNGFNFFEHFLNTKHGYFEENLELSQKIHDKVTYFRFCPEKKQSI